VGGNFVGMIVVERRAEISMKYVGRKVVGNEYVVDMLVVKGIP